MKAIIVVLLLCACSFIYAAPTELRTWESTSGSKIEAVAMKVVNGTAYFKKEGARKFIKVPLTKLSDADQEFLKAHFKINDEDAKPKAFVSDREAADGLPVERGVVKTVPIVVKEGISYRLYIPKSLKKSKVYPLLYYTSSGGGKQRIIDAMIKGAEVNQWIVATPVESDNRSKNNGEQMESCFNHIVSTIPLDSQRIYLIGGSGGARRAFLFADYLRKNKIKPAGLISIVAGYTRHPFDKNICHYYINGGTDFNRYESANSYNITGKKSVIRIHPGKHEVGPHIMISEAMTYLNGLFLEKAKGKAYGQMRKEYEASVIAWIEELKAEEPYRAYYWADYLNEYKVSSIFKKKLGSLHKELGANKSNVDYIEGLKDIAGFVSKEFPKIKDSTGSKMSFNEPKSSKKALKLAEKYAHVKWIHDCFISLSSKTGKL